MRGLRYLSLIAALTLTIAGILAGCSDNETSPAMGTLTVRMTDAPAAIDAINLDIIEVSAHRAGDEATGWEVLRTDTLSVDLLTLRNAVFTTLATARVPAGNYDQIRLLLGSGSTIVVDGVTYPLTVPSGQQSGLKIVGAFNVPANGVIELQLDFDAARSIVLTGSGTYILKPVVRIMPAATAGAIRGKVLPENVPTTVYAIQASDTLGSAMTETDGDFTVSVLPAGVYSVAFHPTGAYRDTTLVNVNVTAGATTDVGTVQLTPSL
jgi:Domain of unknown function (DUF4382)